MKKIFSLLCIIVLLISLSTTAIAEETEPTAVFTDVSETDDFYEAVMYLYYHNIISGVDTGVFAPNSNATRAQVVFTLWKMLNRPIESGSYPTFSDCISSKYYYPAVIWASSANVQIIHGYPDGTFKPNNNMTISEFYEVLYNFAVYAGYASKTQNDLLYYTQIFDTSLLTEKNTFSNWAKPAIGWALDNGFITDYDITGNQIILRSMLATALFHFYQTYQDKYALIVCNTNSLTGAMIAVNNFDALFSQYGITANIYLNIEREDFADAMEESFADAKALDICYTFLYSHGSISGLHLFTNIGSNGNLQPQFFREQIDLYRGTFVNFITGCHTGTYITIYENGLEIEVEDEFDNEEFTNLLINPDEIEGSESLRNSYRIKTLCSSRREENSYSSYRYATYFWCLGSGYNPGVGQGIKYADINGDLFVSLEELYIYSYDKVLEQLQVYNYEQHIVRYPEEDGFVIFED